MAQTIAMVNLDMVGRLRDDKLTVYGTGTAVEFDPLVDRLGTEYKFRITKKPGGYGPSDHASFYEKGVPVLHLFTGFHPDYHRPSDDYDKLNIAGMRQIARMVSELVVQLAEAESRPKPLRPNIASLFDGDSSTRPATVDPVKQTPYLGVSATREQTGGGYLVSQVVSGGPAERGGCRVGDRILSLGGAAIVEPRNLLQAVGAHKPGDKVAMIVERGDGKLELSVTLGGR
jgi:hypothetical protein